MVLCCIDCYAIYCCIESLHSSLYKHLLRTLCSDMTNIVVSFVANDHMISIEDVEMTSEVGSSSSHMVYTQCTFVV